MKPKINKIIIIKPKFVNPLAVQQKSLKVSKNVQVFKICVTQESSPENSVFSVFYLKMCNFAKHYTILFKLVLVFRALTFL